MHQNKVALVTGANKGIGLAIARALAARGLTVLVGARDTARGEAAAQGIAGDARAWALDVTRADSIAAAASRIQRELGRLDVLVNNAGIATFGTASTTRVEDVRAVFETNVFGVIAVTQALLPLLRAAPAGRIVNLSTRLGSLTAITDPAFPMRGIGGVAYGPSKSALNAITVAFAQELAGTNIKVNAACPGHTATDLNGHSGHRTVDEAATEPVRLALLGDDGDTGTFSNEAGTIPW
ncbi:MAG: SDR family NAD(P)-dependent oxidoreductase [Myxococcales bacterium]|nr:MAG: SDR family NAD(P)-dependent oxidoreductase [Myxococcales bacterium]